VDGQLYIGRNIIHLRYPVAEAIVVMNRIVVRLVVPPKEKFNRNVYALNYDGKLMWQIEEAPAGGDIAKPFMNLWLSNDGSLIAGNWIGVDYRVALENGRIEATAFTK